MKTDHFDKKKKPVVSSSVLSMSNLLVLDDKQFVGREKEVFFRCPCNFYFLKKPTENFGVGGDNKQIA